MLMYYFYLFNIDSRIFAQLILRLISKDKLLWKIINCNRYVFSVCRYFSIEQFILKHEIFVGTYVNVNTHIL